MYVLITKTLSEGYFMKVFQQATEYTTRLNLCIRLQFQDNFDIQRTVHRSKFLVIKPTRCTNFSNLFWNETLQVWESSSVHHQEYIFFLMLTIPKCLHTYINYDVLVKHNKLYYYIRVLWATCFDSYRVIFRPFKNQIQDKMTLKKHCGIPKA